VTNDVDLVIDPTAEQLDQFFALFGDQQHLRRESPHEPNTASLRTVAVADIFYPR
jgi:hypothetical protein